jgi:hypothetical protein
MLSWFRRTDSLSGNTESTSDLQVTQCTQYSCWQSGPDCPEGSKQETQSLSELACHLSCRKCLPQVLEALFSALQSVLSVMLFSHAQHSIEGTSASLAEARLPAASTLQSAYQYSTEL